MTLKTPKTAASPTSAARTIPVFAYGSNLDEDQMGTRCPSSFPTFSATLPGYRLAFQGHSRGWGGGVATVVRDPSADVRGMIYEVTPEDLAALDRCEGHPFVYQRALMPVITADDETRMVQVYRRTPGPSTTPSSEYFETISAAYSRLGFDEESLERAAQAATVEEPVGEVVVERLPSPPAPSLLSDLPEGERRRVFVYGSLMRGLGNHPVLSRNGRAEFVREARTLPLYSMIDLGSFPAVLETGDTAIVGEVWEIDAECLRALDRLEGNPDFYYRDEVLLEDVEDGDLLPAGVESYFLPHRANLGSSPVDGGDWRSHYQMKRRNPWDRGR